MQTLVFLTTCPIPDTRLGSLAVLPIDFERPPKCGFLHPVEAFKHPPLGVFFCPFGVFKRHRGETVSLGNMEIVNEWYHKLVVRRPLGLVPFLFYQLVRELLLISIRTSNDVVFVEISYFYYANIKFSQSHLYPMEIYPSVLPIHGFRVSIACNSSKTSSNRSFQQKNEHWWKWKCHRQQGLICSNGHEVTRQSTEPDVAIAAFMVFIVLIWYSTRNILHSGSWNKWMLLRVTANMDIVSTSQTFRQWYCRSMVSLFLTVRTAFLTCPGRGLYIINYWSWNVASILYCGTLQWMCGFVVSFIIHYVMSNLVYSSYCCQ